MIGVYGVRTGRFIGRSPVAAVNFYHIMINNGSYIDNTLKVQ